MGIVKESSYAWLLKKYQEMNKRVTDAETEFEAAKTDRVNYKIDMRTRILAIEDIKMELMFAGQLKCRKPASYSSAAVVDKQFFLHTRRTFADFGRDVGGGRGMLGDGDREPSRWQPRLVQVIHAVPEPNAEFKSYLIKQFPDKTAEMMMFFEELWNNSHQMNINDVLESDRALVNGLWSPRDPEVVKFLGITQDELNQIHGPIDYIN